MSNLKGKTLSFFNKSIPFLELGKFITVTACAHAYTLT